MNKYDSFCKILDSIGNVSVALSAYESPATRPKKKTDWKKIHRKMKRRRGEK